MSTGKATNVDACRDLSGRRLSTIKEAQRQSEMIESVAALKAAASAADKAKLEALERQLGITSAPDDRGEGSSSGKRNADVDLEELARKKHRFDDNEFLEQSREINDNVRNAVAAGLLKKKKKPKTTEASAAAAPTSADKGKGKQTVKAASKADKDTVAMPPPSVSKTAAVA